MRGGDHERMALQLIRYVAERWVVEYAINSTGIEASALRMGDAVFEREIAEFKLRAIVALTKIPVPSVDASAERDAERLADFNRGWEAHDRAMRGIARD